jgi:hypothetical protein
MSAEEILARARTALTASPSFRVKGSATVAIFRHLRHGPRWDRVSGTQMSLGQVTEFVRIGNDVYVKAGSGFWVHHRRSESLAVVSTRVKVDPTSPNFRSWRRQPRATWPTRAW